MRTMLSIGTVAAAAMIFGATDTAKADHCRGGGFGGYGYSAYNYGYSPRYMGGYTARYYSPGVSFGYYSSPRYGYSSNYLFGGRRGGFGISIGRGYYGRNSFRGGRGFRYGGRRGFRR